MKNLMKVFPLLVAVMLFYGPAIAQGKVPAISGTGMVSLTVLLLAVGAFFLLKKRRK